MVVWWQTQHNEAKVSSRSSRSNTTCVHASATLNYEPPTTCSQPSYSTPMLSCLIVGDSTYAHVDNNAPMCLPLAYKAGKHRVM